jgi:hypothetical protein
MKGFECPDKETGLFSRWQEATEGSNERNVFEV